MIEINTTYMDHFPCVSLLSSNDIWNITTYFEQPLSLCCPQKIILILKLLVSTLTVLYLKNIMLFPNCNFIVEYLHLPSSSL